MKLALKPQGFVFMRLIRSANPRGFVLRRYRFIVLLMALALACGMSGFALVQSASQLSGSSQRYVNPSGDTAPRLAAQAEEQRRAQVEAQREALERSERQAAAAQAEQIRQAEERGNQERREQAEGERRRVEKQHEEEWRAALRARQQPPVAAQEEPGRQPPNPRAETLPSLTPSGSPNPAKPAAAQFPVRRLGLAIFAALSVMVSGWMLYRVAYR